MWSHQIFHWWSPEGKVHGDHGLHSRGLRNVLSDALGLTVVARSPEDDALHSEWLDGLRTRFTLEGSSVVWSVVVRLPL